MKTKSPLWVPLTLPRSSNGAKTYRATSTWHRVSRSFWWSPHLLFKVGTFSSAATHRNSHRWFNRVYDWRSHLWPSRNIWVSQHVWYAASLLIWKLSLSLDYLVLPYSCYCARGRRLHSCYKHDSARAVPSTWVGSRCFSLRRGLIQ